MLAGTARGQRIQRVASPRPPSRPALNRMPPFGYNAGMSGKRIDRLEAQLETWIEGAFARLMHRSISARDIAILLLRAMEDQAILLSDGSERIAPDIYRISLHPDAIALFLSQYPDLAERFAELILDLSAQAGFHLYGSPQLEFVADAALPKHKTRISAEHSPESISPTEAMQALVAADPAPPQQQLLYIDERRVVPLCKPLINIGRESSNDIVIADEYVSRHHLQLRRRFGSYTLFDVHSRGGTTVNNTPVREHPLQNGDVIHIGHTRLVYADEAASPLSDSTTQVLAPDEDGL